MRISSPAFTSILTGFSLRTGAVSRAGRSKRYRGDPRLAGFGGTDRADGGADRKGGKDEGADQGGGGLRDTIGPEHGSLLNLALPPPTLSAVTSKVKQGLCQAAKLAEIRHFSIMTPVQDN